LQRNKNYDFPNNKVRVLEMVSKMSDDIKSSEITDEKTYLNRRNFMRAGLLAGTTLATAGVYRFINPPPTKEVVTASIEDISKS